MKELTVAQLVKSRSFLLPLLNLKDTVKEAKSGPPNKKLT
jgi:hypothetical protein